MKKEKYTTQDRAVHGKSDASALPTTPRRWGGFKKVVALVTALVFTWSMICPVGFAETINLEGGSVEVNTQENTTNWNVTGNPVWNVPEFNVPQNSIYNITGLNQNASLALLVNGGQATNIFGTMNLSNLAFILQNLAGINIGSSAMINLNNASLLASTMALNTSATDFFARQYAFSGEGGFLTNDGKIVGNNADLVALIANAIENTGTIEVPMGTVALAAGNTVTVGISGDGLVSIGVDEATANKLGLESQIKNTGTISADGGKVVLNAQAMDGLFEKAISLEKNGAAVSVVKADNGVIEFQSLDDIYNEALVQARGGEIKINIQDDGSRIADDGKQITNAPSDILNPASGSFTNAGTIDAEKGKIEAMVLDDIMNEALIKAQEGSIQLVSTEKNVINKGEIAADKGKIEVTAKRDIVNEAIMSALGGEVRVVAVEGNITNQGTMKADDGVLHLTAKQSAYNKMLMEAIHGKIEVESTEGEVVNEGTIRATEGTAALTARQDVMNAGAIEAPKGEIQVTSREGRVANLGAMKAPEGSVKLSAEQAAYNKMLIEVLNGRIDVTSNKAEIINEGTLDATGGSLNLKAAGAVETKGVLKADEVIERGASFKMGGRIEVGTMDMDNLDNRADIAEWAMLSGNFTDQDNISVLGDFMLTGDTTIQTDSDGLNDDGILTWASNYWLYGEGYNLTLKVSKNSTIGALYQVNQLTLDVNTGKTATYTAAPVTDDFDVQTIKTNYGATLSKDVIDGDGYHLIFSASNAPGGLQYMGTNTTTLGYNYKVMNNIDASETSSWNTNTGFVAVGPDNITPYKGTFDGQGYTISNLFINRTGMIKIGLFGWVDTTATLKNVNLESVNITGNSLYVGGLASTNYGTITDSTVSGTVTGGESTGLLAGISYGSSAVINNSSSSGTVTSTNFRAGGLVGLMNGGTISNSHSSANVISVSENYQGRSNAGGLVGSVGENVSTGVITNSYATGTVQGAGNYVGGLIGYYYAGSLSNSYATGNVTGGTGGTDEAGGLVGQAYTNGAISNSYATGNVSGAGMLGGLIGRSYSAVQNSYATGAVTGGGINGGLIGMKSGGTVTSSYYDKTLHPGLTGEATYGKTTAEMKDPATFTGWDLNGLWVMSAGAYPQLVWQGMNDGDFIGGTSAHPYQIGDVHELQFMAYDLDGYFQLANDIDASPTSGWNSGAGFDPIGVDIVTPFTGNFDGQGHTISGLYINRAEGYLGLFGAYNGSSNLRNVGMVDVNITGTGSYVGGLVGMNMGTVSDAFATGSVTGGDYVGGLIGFNRYASTMNSYADVDVHGGSQVGGLIGDNLGGLFPGDGAITNSYASGNVMGTGADVGGLIGNNRGVGGPEGVITQSYYDNSSAITGATNTIGATAHSNLVNPSWSGFSGWDFDADGVSAGHNGHWVMAGLPHLQTEWTDTITNAAQLQMMKLDLDASYVLANDIDASQTDLWNYSGSGSTYYGFVPVGGFAGTLNGQSHAITDLYINMTNGDSGLFASTAGSANISNIRILNAEIHGGGSWTNAGVLVGNHASGTITNVYASGTVAGTSYMGGLTGRNYFGTTVSNSAADVAVTGGYMTGGMTGLNYGSISNSYAKGAVTGSSFAGGLVGYNSQGSISYSYSSGAVSGSTQGGLVATNTPGSITNSYWDTQTSGRATSAGGTGLTTAQMKNAANFSSWDFDADGVSAGHNGNWIMAGYPHLQNEWTTTITNAAELQMMALDLDANYTLANDIDVSETANWNGAGIGFDPVGDGVTNFNGNFDGSGHTITGLFINRPAEDYIGLFGWTNGDVSDLGLVNVAVTGRSLVGGLAGVSSASNTISGVYITGGVSGTSTVGGLVGVNGGGSMINDSYSSAVVSGGSGVGGLVGGLAMGASIRNSYSTGAVSGSSSVGGLLGNLSSQFASVTNSFAAGVATSTGDTPGGLMGTYASGTLTNNWWYNATNAMGVGTGNLPAGQVDKAVNASAFYSSSHAVYTGSSPWDFDGDGVSAGHNGVWIMAGLPHLQHEWTDTITNVTQLQMMALDLDANYTLANDIDASATSSWNAGAGFDPVGIAWDNAFSGTFDGNDKTITGLTIARSGESGVGLFSYTSGATIQDVTLASESVSGGSSSVAGLVGSMGGGSISHSHVTGTITGTNSWVGGLVGALGGGGSISNSSAAGTVNGAWILGGLVGRMDDSFISNSTAAVTVNGTGMENGGLVGLKYGGSISGSSASGTVTGTNFLGGLAGVALGGTISGSTATGLVNGTGTSLGGLVGSGNLAEITASYSPKIYNDLDLQFMKYDLDGNFTLMRDIDASGTANWNYDSGSGTYLGFDPVGDSSTSFSGALTGNSKTITGLKINRPTESYVGLFGYKTGATTISDLTLASANIAGQNYTGALAGAISTGQVQNAAVTGVTVNSSGQYVGGLAGYSNGTITGSSSTGTVTGNKDVGGLVGRAGSGMGGGSVSNSYSDANVTGANYYVGGLIGEGWSTVSNSHATGIVINTSQYTGGLIGYTNGAVSDSYATGVVSGGAETGGLIGATYGAVDRSYATGAVSGTVVVGGLLGWIVSSTVSDSHATGAVSGTGDIGGLVGMNQGTIQTSYATGASSGTSNIGGLVGENYYGTVTSSYATGDVTGTTDFGGLVGYNEQSGITNITDSYAHKIYNVLDLQLMQNDLDGNFALMNDVDASVTAGWNSGAGFDPVGYDTSHPFTGSFDGANHTISGLTINRPTESYTGLFGVWGTGGFEGEGGILQNVGLTNADITGASSVGALIGEVLTGTINNVYSTGTVDGGGSLGGLIGRFGSGAATSTLTNSHSDATVTGTGGSVGGLVGQSWANISDSYATGDVSGTIGIGGLIGGRHMGTLTRSYATGDVTASSIMAGGLVGSNVNGFSNSFATGNVMGASRVGGLVGNQNGGDVSYSYATGSVQGADSVGGLIGELLGGSLTHTYAAGAVTADTGKGGLVGVDEYGPTYTANFWNTTTSAMTDGVSNQDPDPAGVTGKTTAEMQGALLYANAGWDIFTPVWDTYTDALPTLSWQNAAAGTPNYIWKGGATGVETDWSTASNWVAGLTPDSGASVYIFNRTYDPVLTATSNAGNLTIASGGVLDGASYALNVSGDWTNAGTFTSGTGTVAFDGSALQTIDVGSSTFNNLIFSGSGFSFLNNDLRATGDITFNAGTLTLNGNTITSNGSIAVNTDIHPTDYLFMIADDGMTIAGDLTNDFGMTFSYDKDGLGSGDFVMTAGSSITANEELTIRSNMSGTGTGNAVVRDISAYGSGLDGAMLSIQGYNVTVDGPVSGEQIFSLLAKNNLTINNTVTASGGAWDIYIKADSDGNGAGQLNFADGVVLNLYRAEISGANSFDITAPAGAGDFRLSTDGGLTGAEVNATGPGNQLRTFYLTASGENNITVGHAISPDLITSFSAGGDININASISDSENGMYFTADSNSNSQGAFTMADGTALSKNIGLNSLSIQAGEDVVLEGVTSGNDLTVTSANGSILGASADHLLSGATMTLNANSVGTSGTPVKTSATDLLVTADAGGAYITETNDVDVNTWNVQGAGALASTSGNIDLDGSITLIGTTTFGASGTVTNSAGKILDANDRGLTIQGNFVNAGTLQGGSGLLSFDGNFDNSSGTLTAETSAISFDGSASQSIIPGWGHALYNVIINGVCSLPAAMMGLNVNSLTVQSGKSIDLNGASVSIRGENASGYSLNNSGSIIDSGTLSFNATSGDMLIRAGASNLGDVSFGNGTNYARWELADDMAADSLSLNTNAVVDMTGHGLTVTGYAPSGYSMTVGGTLSNVGSTTFTSVGSTDTKVQSGGQNLGDVTFGMGGMWELEGDLHADSLNVVGNMRMGSITYYDLYIHGQDGSGYSLKAPGGMYNFSDVYFIGNQGGLISTSTNAGIGNATFGDGTNTATWTTTGLIYGNSITIRPNATLAGGTSDLNLYNNWTNNGTFSAGTGTVTFAGGAQQISGTNAFYDLVMAGSGTKTIDMVNTSITHTGTISGTAQVLLEVDATGVNKVYDSTNAATVNLSIARNIFSPWYTVTPGTYTASFDAGKNVGAGKAISVSGISLAGAAAAKFTSNTTDTTAANITKAAALLSGITASNKVYDQTIAATVSTAGAAFAGKYAGDVLTVSSAGTFSDKNAADGKTVNLTNTFGGADLGNYNITDQATTTADITKATVTLSGITASNKVYDQTTVATTNTAGAAFAGKYAGDVLTVSSTGTFSDKNVGTGKTITLVNTFGGADLGNYNITDQGTTTADITKATVTLSGITASNKIYDQTTAATVSTVGAAFAGKYDGDVLTVSSTGVFGDKNVAVGKTVTLTNTFGGADLGNYTITDQGTTTADITQKAVTLGGITASNKVYDQTTAATVSVAGAVFTGMIDGDELTVNSTGVFGDKNVADGKTVTLTNTFGGTDLGNYSITDQGTTTADITAKAVTLSGITASNKVYDGTVDATVSSTGAVFTGMIDGDELTVNSTGVFSDKNVANGKTVTLANAFGGADLGNYSITDQGTTTADITAKAVTLSGITASSKVYDQTTAATVSTTGATFVGMVDGDDLTVSSEGVFSDKNVGTGKTVTLTNTLDGADLANYTITDQGTTTADITKASVTLSGITVSNKVYDQTTVATVSTAGAVFSGMYAGDELTVFSTGVFSDKNVANGKTVTLTNTLGGVDLENYEITDQETTLANITKATATLSGITASNKTYDSTTSATVNAAGAAFDGLYSGDELTVSSTGAFSDKNAGTAKTVNLANILGGTDLGNYTVIDQTTTTADIAKAAATLSGLTASNKVYDQTTAATISTAGAAFAGKFGSDELTVSSTGVFSDKNVASGKTVTLTNAFGGADLNNYNITDQATTTADITKATVTLSGITASNKVYDSTTAATVSTVGAAFGGKYAGDVLTVSSTGVFSDKNVANGKTVTLTNTFGGADLGNYNITDQGTTTADITKATVTLSGITASNKVYDQTTAATVSTAGAAFGGKYAGDVLTVSSTGVFSDKNVAAGKTVTLTNTFGGADLGNYNITDQGTTTANITQKAVTLGGITASNKVYDATTDVTVSTAGAAFTGLISGDDLTVSSTGVFSDKNAGTAKQVDLTNILGGVDLNNYMVIDQQTTTADITKATVTLSGITASNKVYDSTPAATISTAGAAFAGLIGGDELTVSSTGTFSDKNVGTGKTVTLANAIGGADAGNYTVVDQGTTVADITKATVTLGGITALDKFYDGNTAATVSTAGAAFAGKYAGDVLTVSSIGVFDDKNVGTDKTVTLTNTFGGTDLGNYTVIDQPTTTADIRARGVAIDLTGNRVYDGTVNLVAEIFTLNNLVGDETLTLTGVGTMADKHVGTGKTVTLGTLTLGDGTNGGLASNYTLTGGTHTVDITAAPIMISAENISKTYDGGLAAPTTARIYSGQLFDTDAISGGTFAFTDKNVGYANKTITVSDVTINDGNSGNNYAITYVDNTTSTINPYTVNLSGSRVYDGTLNLAAGIFSLNALVGSETLTLIGVGELSDKNVGTGKSVSVGSLTLADGTNGGLAANYTLAGGTHISDVTKASVALSGIQALNKVYDAATGATINTSGATFAGKFGSDDLTVSSTGVFSDKNAASGKTVTLTNTFGGADLGNYNITDQGTTTADITKATVTLSGITASNKVYDQTTAATVSTAGAAFTGKYAGDVLTVSSTGTFGDKNVGTGKTVTLTNTFGGADLGNYNITDQGTTTADITKSAVTLSGITASNKVYDQTTAATVSTAGAAFAGKYAGDVLTVSSTGVFSDKNVANGKTVTLTNTFGGADLGNYNITDQGTTTADITARPLTVTATGIHKVYDGTTTAAVTLSDNRLAGDVLAPSYTTAAYADSLVGTAKPVAVSGISLSGADSYNYAFNEVAVTLADITPVPVAIIPPPVVVDPPPIVINPPVVTPVTPPPVVIVEPPPVDNIPLPINLELPTTPVVTPVTPPSQPVTPPVSQPVTPPSQSVTPPAQSVTPPSSSGTQTSPVTGTPAQGQSQNSANSTETQPSSSEGNSGADSSASEEREAGAVTKDEAAVENDGVAPATEEGANVQWRDAPIDMMMKNEDNRKFLTDVRVLEGAVYVIDAVNTMSLLGMGDSMRVLYKKRVRKAIKALKKVDIQERKKSQDEVAKAEDLVVETIPQEVPKEPATPEMKEALTQILNKVKEEPEVEPAPANRVLKSASPVIMRQTKTGERYGTLKNPGRDVFVRSNGGDWKAAADGMIILPGDEVKTADRNSVEVLMDDGKTGRVEIKEGSLFRIQKAETDSVTGDKTTLLDLAMGKILVKVESLKGNSRFEVRTPTALTGVRGTVFEVTVKEKA